jgi:hypothetical protein
MRRLPWIPIVAALLAAAFVWTRPVRKAAPARKATLSFELVAARDDLTMAISQVAGSDPRATELGVAVSVDVWEGPDFDRHSDYYLRAADRDSLRTYVRELQHDPRFLPPDDEEIVIGPARESRWRTYLVRRGGPIGIASADVMWNPTTRKPEVLVVLDAPSRETFASLTSKNVGQKLAILVDGVVNSAPVIMAPITAGRTTIFVGDDRKQAEEFAAALGPPAVTTAAFVPRSASERTTWALVAGAIVLALGLIGRRVLPLAPITRPSWPRASGGRLPLGRLAVTLAAPIAIYLGRAVRIPGADHDLVRELGLASHASLLSVFALGLHPMVSAFLIVALVAFVSRSRARLVRPIVILTVILALAQSFFYAKWLEHLELSHASALTITLTVTAGTLCLAVLAGVVSTFGLGNGVAIVMISTVAFDEHSLRSVSAIIVVAMTLWLLSRRASSQRLPSSGIVPLLAQASALVIPVAVWSAPSGHVLVQALSVVALAWLLTESFALAPALVSAIVLAAAYLLSSAAVMLMIATAVVADVARDFHARARLGDLTGACSLHRVEDADRALAALADAGIPAHASGLCVRTLLRFLAPYVPIDVHVPAARRDEAIAILGARS